VVRPAPQDPLRPTHLPLVLQPICRRCRCISFKDSACRCFGYAISKKRYIYTIDDDCFVAKDPTGAQINALQQHIENLLSPSTPFFFNTLYDPYAPGTDFVRGYPFSLREGAPTAVSHGTLPAVQASCLPSAPFKACDGVRARHKRATTHVHRRLQGCGSTSRTTMRRLRW
jgi:hypothetical protein